ncbi:MAG: hypothetical protein HW416_411 [Chloroflexi bacterium]|nr:hypothetical protein [Chloroflexota bacterium]
MRMTAAIVSALVLLSCAPQTRPAGGGTPDSPPQQAAPKTIVIAALAPIKVYGHTEFQSGGGASLTDIHSAGLVTNDPKGGFEPRLAVKLPSVDDGTIVLLPNGRMQTTWKLRPNVKWHDGTPFTADDVVFGLEVRLDVPGPEAGLSTPQIERMEAPDPLTLVVTWQTTFFKHLELSISELWPYPRHLVGATQRADRESFLNLPYWTTGYVHLGPFKVVDYGLGETQVFERFDDYFLGRPKVDRIIIQAIQDPNTLFANLQAGTVHVTAEEALPTELAIQLRDEWRQSGGGNVFARTENLRYVMLQLNPDWGRPAELSGDARVRRGLYYGLDRAAIRELSLPGLPDTEAESFLRPNDPRGAVVGKPLARYRYDPPQALREMAEAGWLRGADGRLLNAAGQQVQLDMRGSASSAKETSSVSQLWRQTLGVEMVEETVPPARAQDREYRAKYPGMEFRSSNGDNIFALFDSTRRPNAENRYVGGNPTGYVNLAFDRLLDRLYAAIEINDQANIIKQMSDMLADDVPVIPMYVRVDLTAVVKDVRALADDYAGTTLTRGMARNAHLWERI